MDTLGSLESGEKFVLNVPGLDEPIALPYVVLAADTGPVRIASLNLVGQIRLNSALGGLLAAAIREQIGDLTGVVVLTVVEKALQLTQVAAAHLQIDAVAVAYNRIKPHMEAQRRPVMQVGSDSITSGGKFLALYERDLNLLLHAKRGVIVIDDVVSTGGTILGLTDLIDAAARFQNLSPPPILGIFCVAQEGADHPLLPAPLFSLTQLPPPESAVI
jgi:adenine phosphoribosyltransferase